MHQSIRKLLVELNNIKHFRLKVKDYVISLAKYSYKQRINIPFSISNTKYDTANKIADIYSLEVQQTKILSIRNCNIDKVEIQLSLHIFN